MIAVDTTNMCSHLQKGGTCDVDNIVGGYQLFEEDGIYHHLWLAMRDDPELSAVVRSRQLELVRLPEQELHIYGNGKKMLVLAGKAVPKVFREDKLCELL